MGAGALSPGVKRKRREADHSPPSSTEVKTDGVITPHFICLHCVMFNYIIKWRDKFYFYLHFIIY
jgi:hypothetical protein